MDERGSEIATTSVFECHLSPVGRLMDIENFVSNFFYLHSSIVLTFSIGLGLANVNIRKRIFYPLIKTPPRSERVEGGGGLQE